jgi:hypothetical protein
MSDSESEKEIIVNDDSDFEEFMPKGKKRGPA